MADLTNRKINKWYVLNRVDIHKRNVYYLCKCECGTTKKISYSSLVRETSKSCGCYKKTRHGDIVGKVFGLLTILCIGDTKGRKRYASVECECGNINDYTIDSLVSGKRTSCGCRNPNWKGHGEIGLKWWNSRVVVPAKRHKREVNITIEYIWDLFLQQDRKCALTGAPLIMGDHRHIEGMNSSLDRKDNSKGYVKGNVQWVTKQINMFKNKYNDKEFISLCKLVANHNP